MIFQIIAGYFEDDCADELTNKPVFTEILHTFEHKKQGAQIFVFAQPTISGSWNRMDETMLEQLNEISESITKIKMTEIGDR